MDKALSHGQRTIANVYHQQHLALRVHRSPDPLRRPLQARDGFSLTDRAVLDRAEQRKQLIELDLLDTHIVQGVSGKCLELICRFDEPLQDCIGIDLEHPRGAPDTQALGQAHEDAHDELDRGALTMKDRAESLEKVAATDDAEQLAPASPIGMAVGAEIAPSRPPSVPAI